MADIQIILHRDSDHLARCFTERLKEEFARDTGDTPRGVMLSGGSTPLVVYKQITGSPVSVPSGLHLFMSDERHVPRDDDGNNFHNATPMFEALGLGPSQGIPVPTEHATAEEAADAYEASMQAFLDAGGTIPFGMLGMGSDGHTASLFSQEHIDAGNGRLAIAVDRPDGRRGISLTPAVFENIERLVFLVAGASKQEQVQNLLNHPERIPAGMIAQAAKGRVQLWCDHAALGLP